MTRTALPFLRSVLLVVSISVQAMAADPMGPDLVRQRARALYEAVHNELGESGCSQFFRLWTQADLDFYLAEEAHWKRLAEKGNFAENIDLYGTIAEAYALADGRHRASPRSLIIDERAIRLRMNTASRSDGIVGHIEGDRFVIEDILNSKILRRRNERIEVGQQDKYLETLQTIGLLFRYRSVDYEFAPAQLDIALSRGTVSLLDANPTEVNEVTSHYTGTSGSRGPRTYHIGMSPVQLRKVTQAVIESIYREREATRQTTFSPNLLHWIETRHAWPNSLDQTCLEGRLTVEIMRRGGRGNVFVDSPISLQEVIRDYGLLPPSNAILIALKKADPERLQTLFALSAYAHQFHHGQAEPVIEYLEKSTAHWEAAEIDPVDLPNHARYCEQFLLGAERPQEEDPAPLVHSSHY